MDRPLLIGFAGYLLLGMLVLLVFDAVTHRISSRFASSATEARTRFAYTGVFLGERLSLAVLLVLMWLFWPTVIFGALFAGKAGDNGKKV